MKKNRLRFLGFKDFRIDIEKPLRDGRFFLFVYGALTSCWKPLLIKGVNFVTNAEGKKIAVQIDMKLLGKIHGRLADLYDVIIAESRSEDEDILWEEAEVELSNAKTQIRRRK